MTSNSNEISAIKQGLLDAVHWDISGEPGGSLVLSHGLTEDGCKHISYAWPDSELHSIPHELSRSALREWGDPIQETKGKLVYGRPGTLNAYTVATYPELREGSKMILTLNKGYISIPSPAGGSPCILSTRPGGKGAASVAVQPSDFDGYIAHVRQMSLFDAPDKRQENWWRLSELKVSLDNCDLINEWTFYCGPHCTNPLIWLSDPVSKWVYPESILTQ